MPFSLTIAAFRFGLGLPLPKGAPADPEAMLLALDRADPAVALWPGIGLEAALAHMRDMDDSRRAARADPAMKAADAEASVRAEALRLKGARIAMARALDSPNSFRERLVAFWADHFTVSTKNRRDRPLPSALAEDAIRPHVNGRFADMLKAVTLHPAMLIYLNQNLSIGPGSPQGQRSGKGLNENLAREVIELHTLGAGSPYSQDDVRQMAELLTGLTVDTTEGFLFRQNWAEPGAEMVLGESFDGRGTAPILEALDLLADRPETAAHLSRKIAVHFLSDDPDPEVVAVLTRAWLDSGGDLSAVYAALLRHPAAWVPQAEKARQPFEFLAAALRGLGVTGAAVMAMEDRDFRRAVTQPMLAMGQPWQAAPGPDGWPEAPAAWISPQRLAIRITWAMSLPQRLVDPMPDPRRFMELVLADRVDERTGWAVTRAETRREGVGLVLASPAFNRR